MLSAATIELIEAAAAAGYRVTPRQIRRYRASGALPDMIIEGRGYAKGIASANAPGTAKQLIRLLQLLGSCRDLDDAVFTLWIDGYEVRTARVRRLLQDLVEKMIEDARVQEGGESFRCASEQVAERMRRRARAPSKRGDRLPTVIEGLVGSGMGLTDIDDAMDGTSALLRDAFTPGIEQVTHLSSILASASDNTLEDLRAMYLQQLQVLRSFDTHPALVGHEGLNDLRRYIGFPLSEIASTVQGLRGFLATIMSWDQHIARP